MRYEDKDRYQFQPRSVKVYRYLRYRPASILAFLWSTTKWVFCGAKPIDWGDGFVMNRREAVKHLWIIHKSTSQCNMGHWFTMDEIMKELRDEKQTD